MVVKFGPHIYDRNFTTLCDKNPGELLHIKFCKLILGVHRKATNHAVRGDLGSLPILIPMLCHSIKYWWHLNDLCYQNVNSLVVDALLDNSKCGANNATWSSYIQSVLRMIGRYDIWEKPNICNKSNIYLVLFILVSIIFILVNGQPLSIHLNLNSEPIAVLKLTLL